ncbi:MAG: cbb3-type cytochrome c oxidase subunit I [Gammaproteobacteria bacterium]|nr:cbb3-type cytochrome c oxidase subunit I [Gammaproteobacteria bacterium]
MTEMDAVAAEEPTGGWWNRWVMKRQGWWLPLSLVFVTGIGSMLFVGYRTYADAPPVPDFVNDAGEPIVAADAVRRGQNIFLQYALMNYGSMFGDGAARGPDFTADALHTVVQVMQAYHLAQQVGNGSDADRAVVALDRARREIKANRYDSARNQVTLTPAQVAAVAALEERYAAMFDGSSHGVSPQAYIERADERVALAHFFFWGAWVCAAARPGTDYSYTHNWPYDEQAGNRPTPAILLWSVVATLGLILALGTILYLYGRYSPIAGWRVGGRDAGYASSAVVDGFQPSPTQRATYKFFALAAALLVLQIVAGVLTVHDFLGLTSIGGFDLRAVVPITVTRAWHLQLALLWISSCWIGASIFVLATASATQPRGQTVLVDVLFALVAVLVCGTLVGLYAGPMGALGDDWRLYGSQGWEFVEPGRLWQGLMFVVFALWGVIVARAVRPLWHRGDPWTLPKWLLYAVTAVLLLSISGFVAGPDTNFVVADFWRWAVIHMWVEAFFEVFATVVLAWFMVLLGFVSHTAASRVVYLATLLFLGSGLLGISHNFYWNAKPVATLAIGSVFSTLQVVPLVLLTLEAWQFARLPKRKLGAAAPATAFGQREAFLFLIAMNFWNFVGAGMFGFIINLPIVNYYEHGTYLTVNHGHAALMGVYGNLALGAALFCARCLLVPERWNAALVRRAFWSLNAGLALMVLLDLFPAGVHQLLTVLEHGLAHARAETYVQGVAFQTLTWARIGGGALFVLGGVLPLAWLFLTRLRDLRAPALNGTPELLQGAPAG